MRRKTVGIVLIVLLLVIVITPIIRYSSALTGAGNGPRLVIEGFDSYAWVWGNGIRLVTEVHPNFKQGGVYFYQRFICPNGHVENVGGGSGWRISFRAQTISGKKARSLLRSVKRVYRQL